MLRVQVYTTYQVTPGSSAISQLTADVSCFLFNTKRVYKVEFLIYIPITHDVL